MGIQSTAMLSSLLLFSFFFFFLNDFFVQTTKAADPHEIKAHLKDGFYDSTCPQAEEIVRRTVAEEYMYDRSVPAALIRLLFHDCFVRGCDASILLDETPYGGPVEKSSPANGKTLGGLDVIDSIKRRLEAECPETVSCSDIIAFAARDGAVLAGIPPYSVASGRRDGTASLARDTRSLPPPYGSIELLIKTFANKGFSEREMVILLGAHSIGGAHCPSFERRLYNFTTEGQQDPSLDSWLAASLKFKCPRPDSFFAQILPTKKVMFDTESPTMLDTSFYKGLLEGKALLTADQELTKNRRTLATVTRMAKDPKRWQKQFPMAMVKLGTLDVLVGDQGEVRRSCRYVNQGSKINY